MKDSSVHQAAWQRHLVCNMQRFRAHHSQRLSRYGLQETCVSSVDGVIKTYRSIKQGTGPTWVIIPGFSSEVLDWELLLPLIAPHCGQILAINLPGHGSSPPPTLQPLTVEHCIQAATLAIKTLIPSEQPCVLVGHSLGGLIALAVAHQTAQQTKGLVLISPFGAPLSAAERARLAATLTIDHYAAALAFTGHLLPDHTPCLARAAFAMCAWAHLNKPHLLELRDSLVTYPGLNADWVRHLPPTLLVWGQDDQVLPASGFDFFASLLPAARLESHRPPHFSHSPLLHGVEALARLMLDWSARLNLQKSSE